VPGRIFELQLADSLFLLSAGIPHLAFNATWRRVEDLVLSGSGATTLRPAALRVGARRRRAQERAASRELQSTPIAQPPQPTQTAAPSTTSSAPDALITVDDGAPPITLRELRFEGFDEWPVLSLRGGRVRLVRCTFVRNRVCPVLVRAHGASLTVESCTFESNGEADNGALGGALHADGGRVDVTSSTFTSNVASEGGALYVASSALVVVLASRFDSNRAAARGGAIAVAGAHVTLGNGTLLVANDALEGGAVWISYSEPHSALVYMLPAPLGRWLPNAFMCEQRLSSDACTPSMYGSTISACESVQPLRS
jgi:hypothetical protein